MGFLIYMKNIFDTHAHYDDKAFDEDRDALFSSMFAENVCCVVNQGTDIASSMRSIEFAEKYDGVYAAVGLHPECLNENSMSDISEIEKLADHPKTAAIGEIGLDYYYDIPKDLQKRVFIAQIELANALSMPVNIHDREAHGDTMDILRQMKPKGILHCFSGSVEMAKEIVGLGMYIGIGGVVTFKNARKTVEVVSEIPLERIVLETDCPYLSPVPNRGKRNDSTNIRYVAQRIAEIKSLTEAEVLNTTKANAKRVYNIKI